MEQQQQHKTMNRETHENHRRVFALAVPFCFNFKCVSLSLSSSLFSLSFGHTMEHLFVCAICID